jgi:hypothetical protein
LTDSQLTTVENQLMSVAPIRSREYLYALAQLLVTGSGPPILYPLTHTISSIHSSLCSSLSYLPHSLMQS